MLALGTMLVAGCGASVPPVTVDQLVAQCDAFKGKSVALAGYLGACAGYDCHVFPSKAAAAAAMRYLGDPQPNQTPPNWIGIGGDEAFDRKAAAFQNSYVTISGRVVADNCTGAGGTDRSAGVEPTDIRAWTPAEGAPADTN